MSDPDEEWPGFESRVAIDRLFNERKYRELIELTTARLASKPDCSQALRFRAHALRESGDAEGAATDFRHLIAALTEVLRFDADSRVRSVRAEAYEMIGDADAARRDRQALIEQAGAAIQDEPSNWWHWLDRATRHQAVGDLQSAYSDLSRVIQLKPDVFGPFLMRAEVLIGLKRYAEALADADRGKEMNWSEPSNHFDLRRAECYLGLGDAASARTCLADLPQPLTARQKECVERQLAECAEIERRAASA